MPPKVLPTFTAAEVQKHNSPASCYVTYAGKVFDVTSFVQDHPGGGDLILEYAGEDVQTIMEDEMSHFHTEAAYEVLEDLVVGRLVQDRVPPTGKAPRDGVEGEVTVNGLKPLDSADASLDAGESDSMPASEEALSIETDAVSDYRRHKFLDLDRPLLMQVWNGGFSKEFYLAQVHRPRHYKSGQSAPLFGNFLEPLSKTPWWIIPTLWLPPVVYGTILSRDGLSSWAHVAAFWLGGLAIWTFVEYGLHRCLFHIDKYLPDNRVALTLHFLLHGIHHYLPMDKLRLVMPPALFIILATPFWKLAHSVFFWNWYAATAVFSGGIFGYICYDVTHYFLHHRSLPAYYRQLKKYHLQHHYGDFQNGFGVTSRFWDRVFGTELAPPMAVKVI